MTTPARPRPAADPAHQAFLALLRLANGLLRELTVTCGRHGITHDQYNVLRILRGVYPAGHPRYEIANRLISRAPDVTRMVDRLVRAGLVERAWSTENRRLSLARISSRGLALLETMQPDISAVIARYTRGLDRAELAWLQAYCDRVAG